MSYRILSDNENRNSQSTCNNANCPTKTIYWNPQVVHSQTGRRTPLSEPFNPHIKAPVLHRCMKQYRPGVYIKKYEDPPIPHTFYHGPDPPSGVHLGISHLWINHEFVQLYKCPLCSFQNIHKDIINHHIKFASDKYHNQSSIRI